VVYPWKVPPPPVANRIDLFMHFPGVSRNGQVARPVEMDKLSSSVYGHSILYGDNVDVDFLKCVFDA
jgi:hypothetical protein